MDKEAGPPCPSCGDKDKEIGIGIFCNWVCKSRYLMSLETSAYLKEELKYPEYLSELDLWVRVGYVKPAMRAKPKPSQFRISIR